MLRERVKEGENKEGSPQSLGGRLKEIPKEGSVLTENLSHKTEELRQAVELATHWKLK